MDAVARLSAALAALGREPDPALDAARDALRRLRVAAMAGQPICPVVVLLCETERDVILGFAADTIPRETVEAVLIGLTMMMLGGEGRVPDDYVPRLGRG